jgi:hypothetical protein
MDKLRLKTKVPADHATHSHPLPCLKTYSSNKPEKKLDFLNNNWSTVLLVEPMVTMDAMEDGLPVSLTMSETTVSPMRKTILTLLLKKHAKV